MIAFFTWLKLIFFFRVTHTFGPLFKMMQQMIIDLAKFMAIWMVILTMFTCVALLSFGELKSFHSLYDVSLIYFESALGSWNFEVYDEKTDEGKEIESVKVIGRMYHIVFLLINVVILLNLVIAILDNTYGVYEPIQNGLYYNVLIHVFPLHEWHDEYGYIVCAQTPFNLLVPIMTPIGIVARWCGYE